MAKKAPENAGKRVTFTVSTKERPDFTLPLAVHVFDEQGALAERGEVRDGKVELSVPEGGFGRKRVIISPISERVHPTAIDAKTLLRLGAYEPVMRLSISGALRQVIEIPGIVIDRWPFCYCWVRGRVVRSADNRAICEARVHICEVDRLPRFIFELPELEVLRLRDDLLRAIRTPVALTPIPLPGPVPDTTINPLIRFERVGLNPQPLPPGERVSLNPQPLPPRARRAQAAMTATSDAISLAPELLASLNSPSSAIVRGALAANAKLILPYLCLWPWWWWRFRCDEVRVVETDSHGRFETVVFYPCGGDRPDLYFWVEYAFATGFETVYRPRIACHTYWDYVCGTEVTIRVSDPRVPGCEGEPNLPGTQVIVVSIGNDIAVREVQTGGATEGLTTTGEPFGATLEPRVDFSRTRLIEDLNIPYYRWSYRRLTRPDGNGGAVDPASVPLGEWRPMDRNVYRHYKIDGIYPSVEMGPVSVALTPNLFRIRPLNPPAGEEWSVINEHVDLATVYFETDALAGAPASPVAEDLAAGRYELKLELFDDGGVLVDWTASGIDLNVADQDAPFGPGTMTTSAAPVYNRVVDPVTGHTMGFRMVIRVDNNRCASEIFPVGGSVTPDPDCGFHNYTSESDSAVLSFIARHPNNFARYTFSTTRGPGAPIAEATTVNQLAGEAGGDGFTEVADFTYSKPVVISSLLGDCSNAAFSEQLYLSALAVNGYGRLSGYDSSDNAAFALAVPCPACECEDEDENDG